MRKTLLFIFLFAAFFSIKAQIPWRVAKDTQSVFNKKDIMFFASPVLADLTNSSRAHDPYAITSGSLNFNLGFNYCIYFKKRIGFNWGIEYSNYLNTTLYKGAFRLKDPVKDKYGDLYLPIRECDLKEKRMIGAVEIPLLIRYRSNSGMDRTSFFIDAGVKTHIVAVSKFKQEGFIESKGAYLVGYTNLFGVLENDPSAGFVKTTYDKKDDMKVEKMGFSLFFSAGVKAKLTEFSDLVVSSTYLYALTDITRNDMDDYVNVFGEKSDYKPMKYSQMGLRVGVILKL
jgi:hypothetical protein